MKSLLLYMRARVHLGGQRTRGAPPGVHRPGDQISKEQSRRGNHARSTRWRMCQFLEAGEHGLVFEV